MSLMSKMIVVAAVTLACVGPAMAAFSGNVIQRFYSGNKICDGTGAQTQLAQASACFPTGNIGVGLTEYPVAAGVPFSNNAQYGGFQCEAPTVGTTGKSPAEIFGFSDSTCSATTGTSGQVAVVTDTARCFSGVNSSDSYKFVCGQCGLQVTQFYNPSSLPLRTEKLRWYSDTACKVRAGDAVDNLNVTTQCVQVRQTSQSISVFCGANGQCTLVWFDDTPNCCWTPTLSGTDGSQYGRFFTDGTCVTIGTNSARITTGDLSGAFSTATLSLFSLAAAAVALFAAKEL